MIAEEHPPALISVVTAVIAGEMALGLAFNISVLVVSRGRLVKGAEHGNTFLASLSAVDIVACLTALPFTLASARLSRYQNNLVFCLFSEGAVALSTTASSLTLLCITLERYQAVTRPAHRGLLSLKPFVFLLFIWTLSAFAFCAPFILHRKDALSRKEMCSLLTMTTNTSLGEALNTSSLGFQEPSNSSKVVDYNKTILECLCIISEENDTDINDKVCLVSCNMAINSSGYLRAYELVYVTSFTITAFAMGLFYLSILKVVRRRLAAKEAVTYRKTTLITKPSATKQDASNLSGGKATLLATNRALPDDSNRQTTIYTCAWSMGTMVKGEQSSQKQQVTQICELDKSKPETSIPMSSVRQTQSERGIKSYEIYETQMSNKQCVMEGHPDQGQSIQCPARGLQTPPEDKPQERQPSSSNSLQEEPLRPQQIKAEQIQDQVVPDLGQERRIRWLSLGIVCVFLLCWGPHVMLTVVEMVQQDSLQLEAAHLVTLMLAYLTVVVHPLIYAFSRKKFRESLARLWHRFREKRRQQARVGPAC